jgi:hypothetical protein
MPSKKRTQALPALSKKYEPQGPDLMGEPPSCFHFGVFKPESDSKEVQKKADKIFKQALAAKKKAGK